MTEEDAFQVYSRHAAGDAERNHREALCRTEPP